MVIILMAGTLLALVLGYIVTRRGMYALSALVSDVKKVKLTALNKRIDPSRWPTELKSLSIALNEMFSRLEQSFQQLLQFSGDLAHELRTPINNLIGEIEVYFSQDVQPEQCQELLLSNLEEARRISKMIESMLFLAQMDDPRKIIDKKKLDVQKEILVIQEYYQAMADESHIKIRCDGASSFLKAEPILFRRMLNNIFSNALKYTPPGGSIHLSVKDLDQNKIEIICADTGIGISKEHLPYVFNRFYRSDQSRSQMISGYGLGLSIVKAIVDLHQGTISIKSQIGKGTQVSIQLPK